MFQAVVMICALTLAPADCDMTTARRYDIIVGDWSLPLACLMAGEEHAAERGMEGGRDGYVKVSCVRSEFRPHG